MWSNKVVIYGTGNGAKKVLEIPELCGKIICVVSQGADEGSFNGLPLYRDTYLNQIDEPFDLIIASQYMDIIYKRILDEGKLANDNLRQVWVPNLLSIKSPYGPYGVRIESKEWDWLEGQFKDEASLKLLTEIKKERQNPNYPSNSFLLFEEGVKYAGIEDYWDKVPGSRRHKNVIIIEAGAYIGDTVEKIVKNVGGSVYQYYAFEPMKENFEVLRQKIFHGIENFIPQKVGLGVKARTAYFLGESDGLDGSHVINERVKEAEKVEIITLDSLELAEEADYYVKMDIEGSELDALKGGTQFIQDKRPNLAICLYHKERDLIEIPQFLKQLVPDYSFYLVGGSHTILIAK